MAEGKSPRGDAAFGLLKKEDTTGGAADVGGGALEGASAGAALGTAILPGWGTAIGAIGGGLLGGLWGYLDPRTSAPGLKLVSKGTSLGTAATKGSGVTPPEKGKDWVSKTPHQGSYQRTTSL
jgi:hypothetical protein